MDEPGDSLSTSAADAATEAAVLLRVLDLQPAQVSLAELSRDLHGERPRFEERDAIERAVRDLIAAGLLRRGGELVLPTRAALRFAELNER